MLKVSQIQKYAKTVSFKYSKIQNRKNIPVLDPPAHFWAFNPGPNHGPGLKVCFCVRH
jgi:hypothetical protein